MKQETIDWIEKITKKDAEEIVDCLFDNELTHPNLKRKSLRVVENLIAGMMKYKIESHIKGMELLKEIDKIQDNK